MTMKAPLAHGPKRTLRVRKRKTRVIAGLSNKALTEALGTAHGIVRVPRGYKAKSDTVIISTKTSLNKKGKNFLLRGRAIKDANPVTAIIASGTKVPRRKESDTTKIAIDEKISIAERLQLLGARPGIRLEGELMKKVLSSILVGAEQVTGSKETAGQLLSNANFDGTGMTAEELVREGRAGRVLSRLDDLRYGSRG